MSLTATARSIPDTLRQAVMIDGQHHLITDEPRRLGGDASGPAPHELFPAALAACVSTTLVMYARTKAWDLGEVTVEVDYDHRSTPRMFEIAILDVAFGDRPIPEGPLGLVAAPIGQDDRQRYFAFSEVIADRLAELGTVA